MPKHLGNYKCVKTQMNAPHMLTWRGKPCGLETVGQPVTQINMNLLVVASGPELDAILDALQQLEDAIGARTSAPADDPIEQHADLLIAKIP